MWKKIKAFLCCGEEERPALVIGDPYEFRRINVELAGLTEQEQTMINSRPVPVTFPLHTDGSGTTPTARLDRARAHTRALSNSLRSATTTAMSGVGPKNSGYSSLANGSTSTMQPLRTEDAQGTHEMKELLLHGISGHETSSSFTGQASTDTAIAGCEEDEDAVRSFQRTK
ncbi:hypothetical protein E4T43_04434 [Aureobasidium subglaciale]|nr:hypothetical protein E4T43_04434 [Aureobasidium subglaciale]